MRERVLWYHSVVEELHHLSARQPKVATRILVALRELGNGRRSDLKKLQGSEDWRLRVGDWRVILRIDGLTIYVLGFSDRQDAY